MSRRSWVSAVALVVLGVGAGLLAFRPSPSVAQRVGGTTGAKYTVVETEGTNLLVVDNSTNTMFYYTVDPGQEVGAPLHLRGSIDLNEVGRPSITPKSAKKAGN